MKGSDIGYGHLQLGHYAEAERWLRSALAALSDVDMALSVLTEAG